MKKFFKSKGFVALVVILIIALVVTGIVGRVTGENYLGNIVTTVTSPVQKFITNVFGGGQQETTTTKSVKKLQEENAKLKEQVDRYKKYEDEAEEYEEEIARLRSLLNIKDTMADYEPIGANIIGKDPGNWFLTFTIDQGIVNDVSRGDPVITDKGLMGRVTEVGKNYAKVMSIIDFNSTISVINKRTQEVCRVTGNLKYQKQGKCKIDYIEGDDLKVGDKLVTSGIGGVFPKGIYIGRVVEIRGDATTYSTYGIVEPAVDFSKIQEILVLRKKG